VEATEKQLEYYETPDGKRPFQDWLLNLRDQNGRRKIKARLDRVSLGNLGYCEAVGNGVLELKIDIGPGYRVYFGQFGNKFVILLNGGDKSSQQRDINLAHEYWADYRRRYGNN
jgi:putative addiction module killer protein